jgi:diadenosine tetraphosphate (Ap4A) HIT family hydrolase
VERRDRGDAPPWDQIFRTAHWDVVHCWPTARQGWLVLASREHREAIADLSDAEAEELGPLLRHTSEALRENLGAVKTFIGDGEPAWVEEAVWNPATVFMNTAR